MSLNCMSSIMINSPRHAYKHLTVNVHITIHPHIDLHVYMVPDVDISRSNEIYIRRNVLVTELVDKHKIISNMYLNRLADVQKRIPDVCINKPVVMH